MIAIYGTGSEITGRKMVERRAKTKLINQCLMKRLVDVAKEKGAHSRAKKYWQTFHCQSQIITSGNRMYSIRCKNRFCAYCNGIRKAELIHTYHPIIKTWEQPYFVTLTAKAVRAKELPKRIRDLNRGFRIIKNKYQKRYTRGRGFRLIGLKTIECNFNPVSRTYNPHLHLIVPNKETATILVNEWLRLWTEKFTHKEAQNQRRVYDSEKDLVEVIKYGAKVITEPNKRKSSRTDSATIYACALDNIYAAMEGCRLIDRFGFNTEKKEKRKAKTMLIADYRFWHYHIESKDWITAEHESTLTAFIPNPTLETLLEMNIDSDLE